MLKKHFCVVSVFLFILFVSSVALAIEVKGEEVRDQSQMKYGIGFQSAFPAWGLSGMLNLNDKSSIQGIFGIIGDLKTYAGRVIYTFDRKTTPHKHNAYGYGMLGLWSYPYTEDSGQKEKTESVFGFGAGAGIEYFFKDFLPEVGWNLEIGIGNVNFKKANYNFSTIMVGGGAHYYF